MTDRPETEEREEHGCGYELPSISKWVAENQWDSVEVRPDEAVRICHGGRCITMPRKNWIRLATDGIAESKHIDAMISAIECYFGPGDSIKVRQRYLDILNRPVELIAPEE